MRVQISDGRPSFCCRSTTEMSGMTSWNSSGCPRGASTAGWRSSRCTSGEYYSNAAWHCTALHSRRGYLFPKFRTAGPYVCDSWGGGGPLRSSADSSFPVSASIANVRDHLFSQRAEVISMLLYQGLALQAGSQPASPLNAGFFRLDSAYCLLFWQQCRAVTLVSLSC